jgi:catechol 2,3-dioxygenase-like lactoylglutathione lyase family enzyme
MELRSFNHASLLVKDVERSRHFYGQILGLPEVPRPKSFDFPGAWFRLGSQEVHLIGEEEEGRTKQVNPGYRRDELAHGHTTHIAFEVANLETAIQHLRAHQVEIVGGPRPRGDGVQQMYICDPDGYVVELFVWEQR